MFWVVVGAVIVCYWFFRSPLSHAVAEQVRAYRPDPARLAEQVEEVAEELRAEVRELRADVVDLTERVDFTERMLVEMRQRDALPAPRPRS